MSPKKFPALCEGRSLDYSQKTCVVNENNLEILYLLDHYSVIWNTVDKIARKSVSPCWCRKVPCSTWYVLSHACDFSTCFCERAQGAHGRLEKRQLHKNKFSWNYDIISINDRVQDVCALFLHRNNWKHLRQQHRFYSIIVVG